MNECSRPVKSGLILLMICANVQVNTMKTEETREPVQVIAIFEWGWLSPLRFRWRDRSFRVRKVNRGWTTKIGDTSIHHFAVTADGLEECELCYNEHAHVWEMINSASPDGSRRSEITFN